MPDVGQVSAHDGRRYIAVAALGSKILTDPELIGEITASDDKLLSSSTESEIIWRTIARARSRGFERAASGLA